MDKPLVSVIIPVYNCDRYLGQALQSVQVSYMLLHPQIGYTLAGLINFLEPGTEWPSWANNDPLTENRNAYSPCTLLVRKAVFDHIGIFDPRYKIGEDTEWFVRAKDAGIPFEILSDIVVQRRIHGSNLCYENPAVRRHTLMEILKASIDRKRNKERT